MLSLLSHLPPAGRSRTGRLTIPGVFALATLLAACSGGATTAPSGSAAASAVPSASAGDSVGASDDPVAAALAQTLPTQVGDVALTVDYGTLPELQDELPNYDDLVLRLRNADVEPEDVVGAVGHPTSGGDDPTVGAILVRDAPPGGLGFLALMQAWIAGIPGATTENTNVGKPVVKVTFTDGSLPLYYYTFDTDPTDEEATDTLYWVRTADQATAEAALTQMP